MTPSHKDDDLPAHTVRLSARARRIRLLVSPREGLVVVIPRESDRKRIPGLLRGHAAWIERAMRRTAEHREHLAVADGAPLPSRVDLPAAGVSFDVTYRRTLANAGARAATVAGRIVVTAPAGDDEACRAALRRWLAREARTLLVPLLEEVSAREGIPFTHATVRAQRTRWGSCSRSGGISLNRSLLFLRPELARCVMVHELVHTLRHDHSPAFWALLRERVPDTDALRRELREGWREVPGWAEEP